LTDSDQNTGHHFSCYPILFSSTIQNNRLKIQVAFQRTLVIKPSKANSINQLTPRIFTQKVNVPISKRFLARRSTKSQRQEPSSNNHRPKSKNLNKNQTRNEDLKS